MKRYFIHNNNSLPNYINSNSNINIIQINYNKYYLLIIDNIYLRKIKLDKINNIINYYDDLSLKFLNKYTNEISYDQYKDLLTINDYTVFNNCTSLTNIPITIFNNPSTTTYLYSFKNCISITSIPYNFIDICGIDNS